jgi:hypothetical protein
VVESQPSKLLVAGSIPVSRSNSVVPATIRDPLDQKLRQKTRVDRCPIIAVDRPRSSGVEHVLGKDGVTSSTLVEGSIDSGFEFEVRIRATGAGLRASDSKR